jgi:hypothetical protein
MVQGLQQSSWYDHLSAWKEQWPKHTNYSRGLIAMLSGRTRDTQNSPVIQKVGICLQQLCDTCKQGSIPMNCGTQKWYCNSLIAWRCPTMPTSKWHTLELISRHGPSNQGGCKSWSPQQPPHPVQIKKVQRCMIHKKQCSSEKTRKVIFHINPDCTPCLFNR